MFTSRQINVFRAVMSTGSVTSAADRLNLSQPSVSRLLGELERQFGCPLFIRKSKGVSPTAEAHLFHEEVERTYGALTALEEAAHEISRCQRGMVSFGCIAAFSFEVAPRALVRLGVPDHPISVNWRMRSSSQLLHWISSGILDLGIAYVDGETSGVREIYRHTVPHMCLLPSDHRLVEKGQPISLSDISHERLIGLRGLTADVLGARDAGSLAQSPVTAEVSFTAAALALAGGGVAIVDPLSAHWFEKSGDMKALPVADLAPYDFALIEPIGKHSSSLCRQLQEFLVEEISAVAGQAK